MHALAYTLGAFALILVLARLKVPLALAVFVGSAVIAAAFGLGVGEIGKTFLAGAIVPRTVALVVLTALLLALSETMRAGGQLEQIVASAKALLRRPVLAMAALPAMVGLIPMPGGALFSAPMVETAAGTEKVDPARLSAVNYWFRHIWEHWWPLYPGVILAVTLTESDLGPFMALSGLPILSGLGPAFRVLGPAPARGTKRKMLRAVSPILVILLVWFVAPCGGRSSPPSSGTCLSPWGLWGAWPGRLGLIACPHGRWRACCAVGASIRWPSWCSA